MDLFKLLGTIAIDNSEANSALSETSANARNTADVVSNSTGTIRSSNKSTGTSWSSLKAKVAEYKTEGMTTSQAWRQAVRDMRSNTETASGGMVSAFKRVGAAVATYMTVTAIKNFGLGCIQAAADANAASSQFTQVFGELESSASTSLSGIADTAGISENRLKGSFTQIAAFAKTTGMDTEAALGLSERAMIAVADSAAFYDRSIEETTESLQSFLKGNYENDAALGLSCTETTRNAAANELYGKSFNELSEAQKQLTLLQMVEDANAASGALGQAARESDTWTNVTGNLKQAWTDFQAVIGSTVLPAAVGVVKTMVGVLESWKDKLPALIDWCREHEAAIQPIKDAVGKVVDAIMDNLVPALRDSLIPLWEALEPVLSVVASVVGGALVTALGILTGVINGVAAAVDDFVRILSGVVDIVTNVFNLIVGVITGDSERIKEAVEGIGEGIVDVFGGLWDAVSGFVKGFVDGVVGFFKGLWDTLVGHSIVPDIIDGIVNCFAGLWKAVSGFIKGFTDNVTDFFSGLKDKVVEVAGKLKDEVSERFNQLKDKVSSAASTAKDKVVSSWNTLKDKTSSLYNSAKDTATNAWNSLKDKVSTAATSAKDKVSSAWSTLKDKTSSLFSGAKDVASSAFSALKSKITGDADGAESTVGSKFSSLKSKVSNAVNGARDVVSSTFSNIKSSISGGAEGALSSVSSKFGSIKSKISDTMGSAKSAVSSAIDNIKSKFNFSWSLPSLKLPHVSISGKFSLNPLSVPKFGISWYNRAMDSAMILNNPTIFGYSAKTGKYLGGGESGNEVVAGESHLIELIGDVVESRTNTHSERIVMLLTRLLDVISGDNRELIRAVLAGQTIVLNNREFARAVREYA